MCSAVDIDIYRPFISGDGCHKQQMLPSFAAVTSYNIYIRFGLEMEKDDFCDILRHSKTFWKFRDIFTCCEADGMQMCLP